MSSSPNYSSDNDNFPHREKSEIQEGLPEDCAQEINLLDLVDNSEIAVQRAIDARIANIYGNITPGNSPINSLYSRINSLIGRRCLKQGKYSRAREVTEDALKLNHRDRIARENIRLLLEEFPFLLHQKRKTHVHPPLGGVAPEPISKIEPDESRKLRIEAYRRRALGYIAKKNYAKAILELRDGLKLDQKQSELHSLLALAYLKQNQRAMAKVHMNKALQLDPEDSTALDIKRQLETK